MKKIVSITVMLFVLGTILPTNLFAAGNDVVPVGSMDGTLYHAVLLKLGKDVYNESERVFTEDEAATITSLTEVYGTVTSLKGIGKLPNLVELGISNADEHRGALARLEGIEEAKKLERLFVGSQCLLEIKGIEKLTGLKQLSLKNNILKNLKGIEKLVNLEWLDVSWNYLTKAEIKLRCPEKFTSDENWLKEQVDSQRKETVKKKKIKIQSPHPKRVTRKTKKMQVRTNFLAKKVSLLNGKKTIKSTKRCVIVDEGGWYYYSLMSLNLKKLGGKKLKIKATGVKALKFTVKKK